MTRFLDQPAQTHAEHSNSLTIHEEVIQLTFDSQGSQAQRLKLLLMNFPGDECFVHLCKM